MSSSSSSSAVKRACDACHRRKVKCIGDGTRPCKNCTSSGLSCTYNAIPQKKGPKGSRAKVISELRETQRQTQLAAQRQGLDSPPGSPVYVRKPGLLSMDIITACVDYFFENLYPTQPILHRRKVGETIAQMETDTEAYCMIVSFCAYMMIQPNTGGAFDGLDDPKPDMQFGNILLQEAIRVRKSINYFENPTIWSVITSFFFFGSYFCLGERYNNTAWFHLREATTLALVMNLQEEATYKMWDPVESSRARRLYWLLFVTERAYALQRHHPISLHATINLPTLEEDPMESAEINGFLHLIRLYRPFSDEFVGLWNQVKTGCSTEWLARMQQQLSESLPLYLQCTESQIVDLRCSQQWLRTMVWTLAIQHGYLSSAAADQAMSFKFPIEISRDLMATANQFSQESMEIHGIGLVEKLFDIACALTDVISCVPQEQSLEYGARDYLSQLITLISSLRGGQQRYIPLLVSKINETMPNAPSYSVPVVTGSGSSRISELYEGSQDACSASNSNVSTPFHSPPLSASGPQVPLFSAFQQEMGMGDSQGSSPFPNMGMTSGIDYGDLTVTTSVDVYANIATYQEATLPPRHESG